LPLVGNGRGGAAKRAGDVASELLPALEHKAAQHDVDVVLVMLDANAFAAVQAARRRAHASGFHERGEDWLPEFGLFKAGYGSWRFATPGRR
jgi:hypothetical protein